VVLTWSFNRLEKFKAVECVSTGVVSVGENVR
jgi:hypothetical protein